jgi:hypothetical protein
MDIGIYGYRKSEFPTLNFGLRQAQAPNFEHYTLNFEQYSLSHSTLLIVGFTCFLRQHGYLSLS